MKNKLTRILVFMLVGMVLGVLICSILITFGYFSAYDSNPDSHTVKLLSIEIYELHKDNVGEYSGTPDHENMIFIGIVFGIMTLFIGELMYLKKFNK